MSDDLLISALDNKLRKQHSLNVLFGEIDKNPNVQGFTQWCGSEKHQSDDDIKELFSKRANTYKNYGFATGHEGLADLDFDWFWVYKRAKEHFKERLDTFTVSTPNGGMRVLVFTEPVKNPEKYKESLKLELHFKKYVVCCGEAIKEDGSTGKYEVVKDTEIKEDKMLAKDLTAFLSELLAKYKFLTYPCIKEKLRRKRNHLTHEQRLAISNFLIHEGIPIREAKEFFSMCPDYDESYSEYQVADTAQRIKDGRLNYPPCGSLKAAFNHDENQCKGCPRKAEYKNKTKAGDPAAVKEPLSHHQQIEVPQHIKEKALDIMTNRDVVKFILDNHQKLHIGDVNLAKSLLVSMGIQSVLNSEGIHPKVNGESGKGKTHCCKAMAHLLPEEYAIETTLSDKAIYYMNLRPGSVVFSDDVNLSEALEGIIKRSTSNYQQGDNYTTIDINRNVKTLKIPPRITWWLTSVDDDQSMQLLNRQFGGGVDESPEQDEKVAQFQLNLAVNGDSGLPENDDVAICREIIRHIKKQTFRVRIPFAAGLEWNDKSNRRNLPIFLDIIKAFAVLRFRQRPIMDGYLLASIEDYEAARELYCSRAENQCLKLTEIELNLCRKLHQLNEADSKTLEINLGLTQGRIHQILHGRKDRPGSGLLHKVKGLHFERRTIKNSEEETATKNYYSLDTFDVLASYGSVVNFPEDKKDEYNRYYNSLIVKTDNSSAITTKTDNNSGTITSITNPITIKNDNGSEVITTITQNEVVSGEGTSITMGNNGQNAIHSNLCNNGNNPATAIDIDGNNPGNSGNSLSTNNDFIINSGNSNVIDNIKKAGKEWERTIGQSISSSNMTDFCMWYCEHADKNAKPSEVRAIAEVIFKITAEKGNSGGYLQSQSEQQSGQRKQKEDRRLQEINDDLSLKLREYYRFFKQDIKSRKGLSSLSKKELERGSIKTAFREYFVHYCPEYMQERGKVEFAISMLQNKGELQ